MEDAISAVLVEPIRHVYALLWRFGLLITDQGTSIGMSSPNESLEVLDVDDE